MAEVSVVTVVGLIVNVALLVLLIKVARFCRWRNTAVATLPYLDRLYFYGFSLAELVAGRFFARFATFNNENDGPGICHVAAALNMLALKNVRSARIAFGIDREEMFPHSWVEFHYKDRWWVLDPIWIERFVMERREYYHTMKIEPQCACDYEQFWGFPISEEIFEKLQSPRTSYLVYELTMIYAHYTGSEKQFHPRIRGLRLADFWDEEPEKLGTHTNVRIYFDLPNFVFSKQTVREFMLKLSRKRPKARTIRRIRKLQRAAQKMIIEHNLRGGDNAA